MATKDSSDELTPPVVTTGVGIARSTSTRSLKDYLALAIATCGVGYLPLAPGTWGSIVGVGIFLLWQTLRFELDKIYTHGHWSPQWIPALWTILVFGLIVGVSMAGIWAATRVEKLLGRKDPGVVVVDEVAGQLITFLPITFLPTQLHVNLWPFIVAGFLLFRLFDIWKPYPIRRLEALETGLGIMADDVLAGAYAAMVLSLLFSIFFLL